MESPNTKKEGVPDLKRRTFFKGLSAIGAVAMLASVGVVTKAMAEDAQAPEHSKEPEKSKADLEIEDEINNKEKTLLRLKLNIEINTRELQKIVLFSLREQDVKDLMSGITGDSLGFRSLYMQKILDVKIMEKLLDMNISIRDRVTEWIDDDRRKGRFKTEESTKAAIAERINVLEREQKEIREKLEKM
ncbi:MAG: twin-arginine translocation signal domain-containing protein [bacterium]|nr:twin-arginine translocation signal domain-containing protein [bacterium]